jgi:hypothetical protein
MSEQIALQDDNEFTDNVPTYPQFRERLLENLWPIFVLAIIMAAVIIVYFHTN